MKIVNPRIVAGRYKNRRIKVPSSARPLTDRIRQSVFDTISDFLPNASCLDLFAGAGTTGIEALSRGAASCIFVEKDAAAGSIIKENLNMLGIPTDQGCVYIKKNNQFLKNSTEKFDLVFADPPFSEASKFKVSEVVNHLGAEGLLVLRWPTNTSLTDYSGLDLVQESTYGESKVYFFRIMQ